MRISDWSSDVCSSDLLFVVDAGAKTLVECDVSGGARHTIAFGLPVGAPAGVTPKFLAAIGDMSGPMGPFAGIAAGADGTLYVSGRSEEHTSDLQSLMRTSYAAFCLTKQTK